MQSSGNASLPSICMLLQDQLERKRLPAICRPKEYNLKVGHQSLMADSDSKSKNK